VFFTAKEDVEDQVALSGTLKSFFLNVPKKDFLFFRHRFGARHVDEILTPAVKEHPLITQIRNNRSRSSRQAQD